MYDFQHYPNALRKQCTFTSFLFIFNIPVTYFYFSFMKENVCLCHNVFNADELQDEKKKMKLNKALLTLK